MICDGNISIALTSLQCDKKCTDRVWRNSSARKRQSLGFSFAFIGVNRLSQLELLAGSILDVCKRREHDLHCVMCARQGSLWACIEFRADLCLKDRRSCLISRWKEIAAPADLKSYSLISSRNYVFAVVATAGFKIKQDMSTYRLRQSLQLHMFNLMTVISVKK